MPQHLNYLAIVVAGAAYYVLGALWYGVFGKTWMALIGKTMEEMKAKSNVMPYVLAALTSMASAAVLAVVLRAAGWDATMGQAVFVAIMLWFGFSLCTAAKHYAFSGASAKLLAIDYGYDLLAFIMMGAILGLWKA